MTRVLVFLLACTLVLPARAQRLEEDEETVYPDLAFAEVSDPNPGSGRGQIVAGWIATGIGLGGVAQAPLCDVDELDLGRRPRRCRNVGIALGVIGLSLGMPWLVFGYQRRAAQKAWKRRHGLAVLPDIHLSSDTLMLDWRF